MEGLGNSLLLITRIQASMAALHADMRVDDVLKGVILCRCILSRRPLAETRA